LETKQYAKITINNSFRLHGGIRKGLTIPLDRVTKFSSTHPLSVASMPNVISLPFSTQT